MERSTTFRRLGTSPVLVTQLGLGGASLGDLYQRISHVQALDTVQVAHELGLHFYDTAPWYGLGLSESRMGLALSSLPREDVVLSSKIGRALTPVARPEEGWEGYGWANSLPFTMSFGFTADDIDAQLADSLQRIGVGRIDCVVIHDLEPQTWQVPNCTQPWRADVPLCCMRTPLRAHSSTAAPLVMFPVFTHTVATCADTMPTAASCVLTC